MTFYVKLETELIIKRLEAVARGNEKAGETVRVPRERRGKTPIDIGIVEQGNTRRIRITLGEDGGSKKNSDMTIGETEDLIAILNYNVLVAKGEIERGD